MVLDSNFQVRLLPVKGVYQDYAWGKPIDSSILKIFKSFSTDTPTSHNAAELWFGIHKNGCSKVKINSNWTSLEEYLLSLDPKSKNFNSLAKILTINKPLSIQLHPDEFQAVALHQNQPKLFPDKNPKPEMAVALSETELLCGIKDPDEILAFLNHHPLATYYLPKDALMTFKNHGIKELCKLIFNAPLHFEKNSIRDLLSQIENHSEHDKVALKVLDTFDSIDAGIIALYLHKHYRIKKGQSIYIKPNVPHAYLSGELFECMMNSDNVVRGGLTNKPIDSANFVELLDGAIFNPLIEGLKTSNYTTSYDISDLPFVLEKIEIDSNNEVNLDSSSQSGHQLLIITEGQGIIKSNEDSTTAQAGSSYYYNTSQPFNLISDRIVLFRLINRS